MKSFQKCGEVGGGEFIPSSTSGTTILISGASGTIITLTPPAGERVRLVTLSTEGGAVESLITIQVGGADAVTSKNLGGDFFTAANSFAISSVGASPGANDMSGYFPPITGRVNEVITVIKDSGSTVNTINYGFQFGK